VNHGLAEHYRYSSAFLLLRPYILTAPELLVVRSAFFEIRDARYVKGSRVLEPAFAIDTALLRGDLV
jgi:hypothetical protein